MTVCPHFQTDFAAELTQVHGEWHDDDPTLAECLPAVLLEPRAWGVRELLAEHEYDDEEIATIRGKAEARLVAQIQTAVDELSELQVRAFATAEEYGYGTPTQVAAVLGGWDGLERERRRIASLDEKTRHARTQSLLAAQWCQMTPGAADPRRRTGCISFLGFSIPMWRVDLLNRLLERLDSRLRVVKTSNWAAHLALILGECEAIPDSVPGAVRIVREHATAAAVPVLVSGARPGGFCFVRNQALEYILREKFGSGDPLFGLGTTLCDQLARALGVRVAALAEQRGGTPESWFRQLLDEECLDYLGGVFAYFETLSPRHYGTAAAMHAVLPQSETLFQQVGESIAQSAAPLQRFADLAETDSDLASAKALMYVSNYWYEGAPSAALLQEQENLALLPLAFSVQDGRMAPELLVAALTQTQEVVAGAFLSFLERVDEYADTDAVYQTQQGVQICARRVDTVLKEQHKLLREARHRRVLPPPDNPHERFAQLSRAKFGMLSPDSRITIQGMGESLRREVYTGVLHTLELPYTTTIPDYLSSKFAALTQPTA